MADGEYIPGVCNIGPEEIARRRNFGWVALLVTVLGFAALWWADVSAWWRLLLFFPAMGSASGFLQAYLRFCTGFSRAGVFNFGPVGETHTVDDPEARARDRRRGNQIGLAAVLIGAVVALAATLVG